MTALVTELNVDSLVSIFTTMADANNPAVLQLERILKKPPLATSPSLSRLLRFIVEETLDGRAESLSEFTLGVRVFNRREDFNPRTDPIVRVQAHHLRARLAQYYAGPGAGDAVVVELPPRKYVPVFRFTEAVAEAPAPVVEQVVEQETPPVQPPATTMPEDRKIRRAVMVAAVAGLLAVAGSPSNWSGRAPAAVRSTHGAPHEPDAVAEDLYVRGRYLLDRQTESALRQSVESFQQAIAYDPRFAAAFAGLADAYNLLAQYGYVSPREGMEQARHAAQQALALAPQLAEGHVSLAAILEAYDWNWAAAEREYRRAIELNPALPEAHLWYGMFLRDQGRIRGPAGTAARRAVGAALGAGQRQPRLWIHDGRRFQRRSGARPSRRGVGSGSVRHRRAVGQRVSVALRWRPSGSGAGRRLTPCRGQPPRLIRAGVHLCQAGPAHGKYAPVP